MSAAGPAGRTRALGKLEAEATAPGRPSVQGSLDVGIRLLVGQVFVVRGVFLVQPVVQLLQEPRIHAGDHLPDFFHLDGGVQHRAGVTIFGDRRLVRPLLCQRLLALQQGIVGVIRNLDQGGTVVSCAMSLMIAA